MKKKRDFHYNPDVELNVPYWHLSEVSTARFLSQIILQQMSGSCTFCFLFSPTLLSFFPLATSIIIFQI